MINLAVSKLLSAAGVIVLSCACEKQILQKNAVTQTREFPTPWSLEHNYLDIRGVGDTAWSNNHKNSPIGPETGNPAARAEQALKAFDPHGRILRGQLNFVNWESVVGEECLEFFGNRFLFLSHPEAVLHAFQHDFNLFAASNNHSRDCHNKAKHGERASEDMTAQNLEKVLGEQEAIWSGIELSTGNTVQRRTMPRTKIFKFSGTEVTVAMNAVHPRRKMLCGFS